MNTCKTCRFSSRDLTLEERGFLGANPNAEIGRSQWNPINEDLRRCRRHAPSLMAGPAAMWPLVSIHDICGDYEERK